MLGVGWRRQSRDECAFYKLRNTDPDSISVQASTRVLPTKFVSVILTAYASYVGVEQGKAPLGDSTD
jgi:hypothetical protein